MGKLILTTKHPPRRTVEKDLKPAEASAGEPQPSDINEARWDGFSPNAIVLSGTREVMQALEAASVLSRTLRSSSEFLEPVVSEEQPSEAERATSRAELVAGKKTMANSCLEDMPSALEKLVSELGLIEHQNQAYYRNHERSRDAMTAYGFRQRRRENILAEIVELTRTRGEN